MTKFDASITHIMARESNNNARIEAVPNGSLIAVYVNEGRPVMFRKDASPSPYGRESHPAFLVAFNRNTPHYLIGFNSSITGIPPGGVVWPKPSGTDSVRWNIHSQAFNCCSYLFQFDSHEAEVFVLARSNNGNLYSKDTSPKLDISDWRAWSHNRDGDCACGIVRKDCSYHR